jgi:hypothetical protein
MQRASLSALADFSVFVGFGSAWQGGNHGPYKVLKSARVGGEGGRDYIYADAVGRLLYIPRGATRAIAATESKPEVPASFVVEQNLQTMNGARTVTFDSKTGHLFTMSQERGPAPPPPPGGCRGGQGSSGTRFVCDSYGRRVKSRAGFRPIPH